MVKRQIGTVFFVAAALFISWVSVSAAQEGEDAQTNRYLGGKFAFRVIGGLVDLSTDVAAGSSLGALIDLEAVLGFDESITTFGIDGFWRFSKNNKHTLRFGYGNYDRDAYKAVAGTVPIFDVDFLGEIESQFVNQLGALEYQYSFTNSRKTEAGITAGFAFYKYEISLAGRVKIDEEPDEFRRESVGVIAPVPVIGLYINQALRPNLILEIRASAINLAYSDHTGRIFNSWGSLTWFFSRHFGVGGGVSAADVSYEKKSGNERIKVDLRQTSLNLSLTAVF